MSKKLRRVKDVSKAFAYGCVAQATSYSTTYYSKRNVYYYVNPADSWMGGNIGRRKRPIARRFAVTGNSKIDTLILFNSTPVVGGTLAEVQRSSDVWNHIYKDHNLKDKTYTCWVPLTSVNNSLPKIIEGTMKYCLKLPTTKIYNRDEILARNAIIKNIEFLIPGCLYKVDMLVRGRFNDHVAIADNIRAKKNQLMLRQVTDLSKTTTRI